jgi:glutathione peroxidase
MTEKTHVKGGKAHPFYKWMRERLGRPAYPAWNFHKLLVGKQGQPLAAFKSRIEPQSPEVRRAIEAAL